MIRAGYRNNNNNDDDDLWLKEIILMIPFDFHIFTFYPKYI